MLSNCNRVTSLCISVKLKNLKANHNGHSDVESARAVVYIRKVKKSESKSQPTRRGCARTIRCVYP